MKLHLPKSLLCAVLTVCISPTIQAGSWTTNDCYTFDGKNDVDTLYATGHVNDSKATWIRAGADDLTPTLKEILQVDGTTLNISGTWSKSATTQAFKLLTIEMLKVGVDGKGSGSLVIASNVNGGNMPLQTIQLNDIDGTLSSIQVLDKGKLILQKNALSDVNNVKTYTQTIQVNKGGTICVGDANTTEIKLNQLSGNGTLEVTMKKEWGNILALKGFSGETYLKSGHFDIYKSTEASLSGATGEGANIAQVGGTLHMGPEAHLQIDSGKTVVLNANLVLDESTGGGVDGTFDGTEFHQNGGANFTINGTVTGDTYNRKGGGSLTFNNTVNLKEFKTASGATSTFNKSTTLQKLIVEHKDATVTLNGNTTISDILTAKKGKVNIGAGEHSVHIFDTSCGGDSTADVYLKKNALVDVTHQLWGCANSTINLEEGATISHDGVSITGATLNGNAIIQASGDAEYATNSDKFTISGAAVTVTSASNVNINNTLSNSSLQNAGAGKLNIINSSNTLTKLSATGGDITVAGKVTMIDSTQSLATIAGATISKSEINSGVAGTLNIKGGVVDNALIALMEGASLKLENVTLGAGTQISGAAAIATVDADGSVSSTGNALTLADTTVQIATSSTSIEVLSDPLSSKMALALDLSTEVKGIAVTASTFANVSLTGEMELNITGDLISELIKRDCKYVAITFDPSVTWRTDTVTITGASFGNGQPAGGVVIDNGKIYVSVPEPTTATLSLLALAALAARRRRK